MRRNRRLMAIVTCMSVILVGCGSADDDTADDPAAVGDTGATDAPEAGESEVLTIWTFKQNHVPALEKIGSDWAATLDRPVDVNVEFYAESDGVYANKIAASVRTNELPDLLSYWGGSQWDLAGQGVLQDLSKDVDDEWMSAFPEPLRDDIQLSEDLAASCADNPDCEYPDVPAGSVYALPQISGATGYVFANRKLLESAGVDQDNPPANWKEWVQAMETTVAKNPRKGGLALGLKVPETGYLWIYRLLSWSHLGPEQYGERFGPDGDWTSPESVETVELYDQLSDIWVPNALQTDISEAEAMFGRGDAAWLVGGTFSFSTFAQAGITPEDVMAFPLPTASGDVIADRELKPWASLMLGITKDVDDRALALEFMRYLFSPEGGATFADEAKDLPAVDVPDDAVSAQALVEMKQAFSDSDDAFDEFAVHGPQCDEASTVTNQAAVELSRLITGESAPTEVAEKFQNIFGSAWDACGG